MPPPTRRRLPQRAASTAQLVELLRLLITAPQTPGELAQQLGCSRKTVERLLTALEEAGLTLQAERRGAHVHYRLPKQHVREKLGL
jgi:DNA-binding IclR family transcriptional regulator